jgi:glyoxylase-like metal-dependent hydrolase (beta-lactamase superfamily II)
MRIGDLDVQLIKAGSLRLDGGAMFGVVPRPLWERKIPPDERNRIGLSMNVCLVRSAGKTILLDTGAGEKFDDRFRDLYGLGPWNLPEALRVRGVRPEQVDVVVNTHLHFDHAGGNTVRDPSGALLPTFPNARYVVQFREWEEALAAHERNRASYIEENYMPLREAGQLELVEGDVEVAPGVRTLPLPGHTLGMQGLLLDSGGRTAVYLADCVPTRHHLPLPWIMGYDLYPVLTLETKRRLLPAAAKEGWTVLFEHDGEMPAALLEEERPLSFRAHAVAP